MLAFVRLALKPGAADIAFRAAMEAHEAVLECHHVTGNWSYLVKLRLANMPALEEFVSAELRSLPGLERLAVDVALSSIKETSLLPVATVDEEEDE